jgi:ABC-type bacteriocin/lantibiotic exporter with double-glycine peptidase domain
MAIEAIENVQTIQLLTREDEFSDKFRIASAKMQRAELAKGPLEAINFAVSQSFMCFVASVSYSIGLHLIINQLAYSNLVYQ